ncbi:MAG: putative 2-ketoarginine decarboxylase AruI [Alphaproteobacteria bacterium MarineAlpha11_Bin1]|nr:MAG: putative 2-ketoarginine decarboxylase AruI [Alphaproteobacteria bacterium MarineAlpha11_Bin1]|tara:strand:- start:941 stop:2602 length:1662 start_codon:yes stop_codon:yes gene_type:complete
MSDRVTAGEIAAIFLESCDVKHAFGVISIHNMPILDAIARRNNINFVAARSEGGSVNMADANARVRGGLGVAISSTGTAAGNACGAIVEALSAGTPLLHLTGQIESEHLDRNKGFIHEAPDQARMLSAAGKGAFRVWSADTMVGTLKEAVRLAFTPPMGPVSVEIPIDVQKDLTTIPASIETLEVPRSAPNTASVDALAEALAQKKRVMLWLGGGARHASDPVARLAKIGFGIVTSVQGRGVLPGDDHQSLGAFNLQPASEEFYQTCDAMLVVGSRLRSNETLTYKLQLPEPLYQIDADPLAGGRAYPVEMFVCGDSKRTLEMLADRLKNRFVPDKSFTKDILVAQQRAEREVRDALGPYDGIVDAVIDAVPRDFVWVRDITLSNTIWGNRLPLLDGPRDGVHALGGGIGQGLPMGIGAALGVQEEGRKTLVLIGDGGFAVTLGEFATAKQENADIVIILMNDGGYGVIKNIADAHFGGRRAYVDILGPDWGKLCGSLDIPYWRVGEAEDFPELLKGAITKNGPSLIEIDMASIGQFAHAFAGPPSKTKSDST